MMPLLRTFYFVLCLRVERGGGDSTGNEMGEILERIAACVEFLRC